MATERVTHGHQARGAMARTGMTVMGGMMGVCLGGTVLAAAAPVLGLAAALGPAVLVGVVFAAVSLRYHRFMGPLMAACCGGAVLVNAAPGLGLAGASLLALAVGAVVGLGSQKLMGRIH